ncbi:TIR domain-containing protein [Croceicoccus naphthovorans]|uniref:TIR domain-containing protein n=1 Tax=Croceicoccus naphthovorans TaxID=1348774 RepID=UPI00069D9F10|nr:TIR domain-containing protein [Croceicoccus naphthovorans]MBB3991955.1 hypothetical protein [Croceicoccus naphthovorans]
MSGPDIFISYSREDRAVARRFADGLGAAGFEVWWDAALHSGETFDEVIERNLRAAKAVVVLWSPRSVKSRWVRAEATLADRTGRLAPAIIEPCDRPIIFELTHTAELAHWTGEQDDAAWGQFVADLRTLVGESAVAEGRIATKAKPQQLTPLEEPAVADDPDAREEPAAKVTAFPAFAARPEAYESDQTQLSGYADLAYAEQHVLEMLDDAESAPFAIGPLGARIGRSAPADVVLGDPRVSRSHCELVFSDGQLVVSDLNSTNGTFVDDERVEGTVPLPVGSVLQVGGIRLVHEVRAAVAAR